MNDQYDLIADGLAQSGYAIVDNFLSSQEVDNILNSGVFQDHTASFKRAGIGKRQDLRINEAVRGDYIQWIDKNSAPDAVMVYVNKLYTLAQYLNQSLFLSIKDNEIHMTIYPAGAFYKRHMDQFKKDDHRKLSVICYLNKSWNDDDGGQLKMFTESGSVEILPLQGRLVCFRSDHLEHEVLPATRDRLSLTGWMLDQYL
ncbi:MAG: 2OG-Fe(II) oxygenase [Chryseolinea sp.]